MIFKQDSPVIPFNMPHMTGKELYNIAQAHFNGKLAGDGPFTKQCHQWLEKNTGSAKALLTHSCTAALELSAILIETEPGDEIIMPSYTFVSTANAFVLRGGRPVFVDVREDTLNIDEKKIEDALTKKTKAIVPVHYAGVACEMDVISQIAKRNKLFVVEDAAQGIMSKYKGRALGTIGDIGCLSFHETKNLISGEGGSLLVNEKDFVQRAEIVREKGTNRTQFLSGAVDKYTWRDIGSSFLPGELIAAFLWAQFEEANIITQNRINAWQVYHALFKDLEDSGFIKRPYIPDNCEHNAHMYYLILDSKFDRSRVLSEMRKNKVEAHFHYVPLHRSPAGKKFGRSHGNLSVTDDLSARLIRLPLWFGITLDQQARVVATLKDSLEAAVMKVA